MPSAPPRVCRRCNKAAPKNKACPCRPAWENSTHPSGNNRTWQKIKAARLQVNPICQWVEQDGTGCRRPATDCDHITPVAEGGEFLDYENTQSLCAPHHTEKTVADALRGKTRLR